MRRMITWVAAAMLAGACGSDDGGDGGAGGSSTDTGAASSGEVVDGSGTDTAAPAACASTPGWVPVEMPWTKLNYEGVPAFGGFTVCTPDAWGTTASPDNIISLVRDGEAVHTITLAGEFRLDHAGAVGRVSDNLSGGCADDRTVEIVEIDGWPAAQVRYTFDGPPCGECPDPDPPTRHAVHTFIAADRFLVSVLGETVAPPDAAIVEELAAIGASMVATEIAAPNPTGTSQELMELETASAAACP